MFVGEYVLILGTHLADASVSTAWQPTQVIFGYVIAVLLHLESLSYIKMFGILLALVGCCIITMLSPSGSGSAQNGRYIIGNFLLCLGCFAGALKVVAFKYIYKAGYSPIAAISYT